MSDKYNKRMYTIGEFYKILYYALRNMKYLRRAKKSKDMDNKFFERIMLAVTEVNGCEICSYKHTEVALKEGMSQEEINSILSGSMDNIPTNESIAIFFAQHYAENKGKPSQEAWLRVVDTYGESKALAILGAIRVIMIGNSYGIAVGALFNRLKGKRVKKNNLGYELGMTFVIIPFIPIVIVHSIMSKITKKPLIEFNKQK